MAKIIPKHTTTIGGQALIEGLMMIGPNHYSIAVRKPDGDIEIQNTNLPPKSKIAKIPIIRGSFLLFKQMIIGIKALMFSAEFFEVEEDSNEEKKPSKIDTFLENIFKDKLKDALIYFSVIISLCFSVGLFMLLPNLFASFINFQKNTFSGNIYFNLFEGVIRVLLFIGYIASMSFMKDIKRIWQYHGAEHKTIHCYESGLDLTVDNIKTFPTAHPRCGTSFLFTVMVISILVFSLAGQHTIIVNLLLRLLLMPLVAGISYEFFKLTGNYDNFFTNIIKAPGLLFQKFTTSEPDEKQIEVALVAMKNVIPTNKEDAWK